MRHPIRHASPLRECLGDHKFRIPKIHIRFHEILDFCAFLQPFRVISPTSSDVSIVPDVFGVQSVRKHEICRYPEDPNPERALSHSMTVPGWPLSHRSHSALLSHLRGMVGTETNTFDRKACLRTYRIRLDDHRRLGPLRCKDGSGFLRGMISFYKNINQGTTST